MSSLINDFRDITDKVVSTWSDQSPDYIRDLEENGFKVIVNQVPDVRNSKTYQQISMLAGLNYIKSEGSYTHVLRTRTDIHYSDIKKVLEIYASYDETKPTFFCWFRNNNYECGYLMNNVVYGPIDVVEKYFSYTCEGNEHIFDEVLFQETLFNDVEKPIPYDAIRNRINLSLDDLNKNGIVVSWTKADKVHEGNLLVRYATCGCKFVGTTGADFIDYQ